MEQRYVLLKEGGFRFKFVGIVQMEITASSSFVHTIMQASTWDR